MSTGPPTERETVRAVAAHRDEEYGSTGDVASRWLAFEADYSSVPTPVVNEALQSRGATATQPARPLALHL
jgi:hypothetical protein